MAYEVETLVLGGSSAVTIVLVMVESVDTRIEERLHCGNFDQEPPLSVLFASVWSAFPWKRAASYILLSLARAEVLLKEALH